MDIDLKHQCEKNPWLCSESSNDQIRISVVMDHADAKTLEHAHPEVIRYLISSRQVSEHPSGISGSEVLK